MCMCVCVCGISSCPPSGQKKIRKRTNRGGCGHLVFGVEIQSPAVLFDAFFGLKFEYKMAAIQVLFYLISLILSIYFMNKTTRIPNYPK